MADRGQGYKYQLSVTAYLASLLSKNGLVKDYYIFYEVQELEPFDDIVLAVKYGQTEQFHLYLIQVKSGKVKLDVNNYVKEYDKITRNKLWKCLDSIGEFSEENIQFWYFACQNFRAQPIPFREDSECNTLEIKRRQFNDNEAIICKNVYELYLTGESLTTKCLDFIKYFYIFLGQPDTSNIANRLKGMWGLNDAGGLIEYFDKYFTRNKRGSLSKMEFEHELLRIRLLNYIVTPTKVIQFKKEAAEAWTGLTLLHNVTIVKSELNIEMGLFACILPSITETISIDQWNNCVDNDGKLNKEIKDKFIGKPLKPETLMDLLIHLWICGKIPLILKTNNGLPLLKDFSHLDQHYVVIDSDPCRRYEELESYNLSVLKDLKQIGAEQLLQSILVSMQGGKPASLYTVINGDKELMGALTCLDIIKLMEPRHLYLNEDCLEDGNYIAFIIESPNAELKNWDDYEADGENIIIYCRPDQSNEIYKKMEQDPKFKSYRIQRSSLENGKLIFANQAHQSSENRQGFEHFLIDQYGQNVYSINEHNVVPVIGKVMKTTCLNYLHRYMRKGVAIKKDNANSETKTTYTGTLFQEKDFFKAMNGRLCVVTGEPGSGKTTLLQSLIQICDPRNYVLFCNLARYKFDIRDNSKKLFKDPLNFLWNKQGSLSFNRFLSAMQKDQKRLIVILDSFDEIIATCKEQALKLIRVLNEKTCLERIIIGSRLLTVNLLSNQFEIEVAKVEGFRSEYNGHYLENWGFNKDSLQKMPVEFVANPLYLNMLRTISESGIEFQSLNRWTLYKTIVDLKIDIYCRRTKEILDYRQRKDILEYHWRLALKAIFGNNEVTQKLAQDDQEWFPNIARVGLIKYYDENEEPVFIHHIFAEFFVGQWLTETNDKNDAKYIYEEMLNKGTLCILDTHCEQFPLHQAVLEFDYNQVEYLCKKDKEILLQTDGIGRAAIHIAAAYLSWYNSESLVIIIKNMRAVGHDLYRRDKLLNWSWIDYYERNPGIKTSLFYNISIVIQEAYWNYYGREVKALIPPHFQEVNFKILFENALKTLSFKLIKDVLSLRYCGNEDFMRFRDGCLNSQINTVELPRYFRLDELGLTPLHVACIYSNINFVIACIERGDNLDIIDVFGHTPLYYSVCKQDHQVAKLLLGKGGKIELSPSSTNDVNIFGMSLKLGNDSITKMLMEEIEINEFGATLLNDAIKFENAEVIEMLLERIINLEGQTISKNPYQPIYGNSFLEEIFQVFTNDCASVDVKNTDELKVIFDTISSNVNEPLKHPQNTSLFLNQAIRTGRRDIVEVFLKYRRDVHFETAEDTTPLCCAIRQGNIDIVELLLQNSANVNYVDKHGLTPIEVAIKENDVDYSKILMNIFIKKIKGDLKSVMSTIAEDSNLVQIIVRNIQVFKNLAFMYASFLDDPEVKRKKLCLVDILLKYGADVNQTNLHYSNMRGFTPLLTAVETENIEVVELLLKNGADANLKTEYDVSPLYIAARKKNPEMVSLLFKHGAHTNITTSANTLLVNAKSAHNIDAILWLLDLCASRSNHPDELIPNETVTKRIASCKDEDTVMYTILESKLDELLNLAKMFFANSTCESAHLDEVVHHIKPKQENINLLAKIAMTRIASYKDAESMVSAILGSKGDKLDFAKISSNSAYDSSYPDAVTDILKTVVNRTNLQNESVATLTAKSKDMKNLLQAIFGKRTNKIFNFIKIYFSNSTCDAVFHDKVADLIKTIENYTGINLLNETAATLFEKYKKNKETVLHTICGNKEDADELLHSLKMYASNLIQDSIYPDEVVHFIKTVEAQANINLVDEIDITRNTTRELVHLLLQHGADLSNPNGIKYVNAVLELNNKDVDQILLSNFLSKNDNNIKRYTSLGYALKQKNQAMVEILLRNGEDVNNTDVWGRNSLFCAIDYNVDTSIIEILSDNQADVNLPNRNGVTPLLAAIRVKNLDAVEILLKRKPILNYLSKNNITPLITGIRGISSVIIRALLDNGADVNLTYPCGFTPLYMAGLMGETNIIKMLLSYGANTNIETSGNVLLSNAIETGDVAVANVLVCHTDFRRKLLISSEVDAIVNKVFYNRADLNSVNESGSTLLHLATEKGCYKIVEKLLGNGANPNQIDRDGRTALHIAVQINREDIVEILLRVGVDENIRDNNDLTPLEYAIQYENPDILRQLVNW